MRLGSVLVRGVGVVTLAFTGLVNAGIPPAAADGPNQPGGHAEQLPATPSGGTRSDAAALYLPEGLGNLRPARPPAPSQAPQSTDPTGVQHLDVATRQVRVTPGGPQVASGPEVEASSPSSAGLLGPSISPQSILGTDDRTRVFNTEDFPWRTIVKVKINASTGTWGCSGPLIGQGTGTTHSFHILLAGHCVHNSDFGTGADMWANSWQIFPGLDDTYMPYNYAWAVGVRTYNAWVNDQNHQHDWALITLDREIGNFTGFMGRFTASSSHTYYDDTLNVSGYPCDKPGSDEQWFDSNVGRTADEYNHWYYMDTIGCQSGAPVWHYNSTTQDRLILTIHAYGNDGSASNHGTRLNNDKYDRIITWTNEDTPPTDRPDLIDNGPAAANISPNLVQRGETNFTVSAQVRNVGTLNSGSFCVAFYLSTNTTISTGDRLLGSDCGLTVAAFSNVTATWTGPVPANTPVDTYYVGWIIDSTGSQTEWDEGNNIGYESGEQVVVEAVPTLSVNNDTGTEGGNVTFTVTLAPASGFTVTVNYNTAGVLDADAGIDYTVPGLTPLTFTPGQTTKTVNIATIEDTLDENNEQFELRLSSPVNATISDGTGIGTITDDDAAPSLSINNVSTTESNAGTKNFNFTVTLTPASGKTVTVNNNATSGTALAPFDFTAIGTTGLTFTPGQTSKTVTVVVNGDATCEANETFNVNLGGAVNATIADALGVGTITNDDGTCVNGGKGLNITAAGASTKTLGWTGGNAQTGYQLVQYNTATAVANLIALGGGATSYNDAAGGAVMFCYVLAATTDGGAVLGLSDLECALPGQETGGAAPTNFKLQLDQSSNASLSWTNAGGVTTLLLQVIPLDGSAVTNINLGTATTTTTQPVVVPDGSCFQLLAFTGAALSTSNVVCGIPGVSTLSVGSTSGQVGLSEVAGVMKEKTAGLARLQQ